MVKVTIVLRSTRAPCPNPPATVHGKRAQPDSLITLRCVSTQRTASMSVLSHVVPQFAQPYPQRRGVRVVEPVQDRQRLGPGLVRAIRVAGLDPGLPEPGEAVRRMLM